MIKTQKQRERNQQKQKAKKSVRTGVIPMYDSSEGEFLTS